MGGEGVSGFEEFVVARTEALLRFGYVLTGDAGRAEDVLQEALLDVHRHWDRLAADGSPEAYIRRAMVNEFVSWRRRRSSRELPGEVPDSPVPDPPDAGLAERDAVWRALARLPRRQRAVLVLRFYEDLSESEIAGVLGCAGGTVRSLATRALHALRTDPDVGRGALVPLEEA
jgi:RNA polymerase sigma-70 factor (sigma-E family)